jgi:D-methionine transport system ATP-binding protein
MRIAYRGDNTSQPIIGYLISHFSLTINIIQANIETIQEQTVGVLVVEVSGEEQKIEESLQFLEKNNLQVEILGYVQRTPPRFI